MRNKQCPLSPNQINQADKLSKQSPSYVNKEKKKETQRT